MGYFLNEAYEKESIQIHSSNQEHHKNKQSQQSRKYDDERSQKDYSIKQIWAIIDQMVYRIQVLEEHVYQQNRINQYRDQRYVQRPGVFQYGMNNPRRR